MSRNREVADRLEEIARMLEILGENRFKVIAHEKAARAIADLPQDVADLDAKQLEAIDGVGAKIAAKIVQYANTGDMTEHAELRAKVPEGLFELMNLPGLGPKTVSLLWKDKHITDLAGLKRIIDDGSIMDLPRMGAKTVQNIKDAIEFNASAGARLPLGVAMPVAEAIVERIRKVEGVKKIAFAGSLRRGKETIGDIDILCAASDPDAARDAFTRQPEVIKVLAAGESKSSVRFSLSSLRLADLGGDAAAVQVDLRLVPEASWGAAMLYFTGSKEHNVRLRERAQKNGWTLNEYGLYPESDDPTPPQHRGAKAIAGKTEEQVFEQFGLPFIPPEIREDRDELSLKTTPRLIELDDIKSELHAHTTASDGRLSIDELATLAHARNFHTIAVTDHSRSSFQANGLDEDRLRAHIKRVRAARVKGIAILTGSEVDILPDGTLDYDDDLLAELDVVVASPHASLSQDPKKATARLLKAIEHPLVHILGHPTGRLLPARKGLEPAMPELIAAAKEHNVALEINAHWKRLDLRDTHVRQAVEAGCLIAIDCDVHRAEHFDNLRYGVLTGRRGWLPPEQCINTWSKARLHAWLKEKRAS
ncbi:MAG: DNA polymerase/3'-5' exonuclease PolX [Phycisphaeraceae bacterium]|nr:DNA polymerase/3'-5' exonuclease PolX [Phycisphaeraceae bacterium]